MLMSKRNSAVTLVASKAGKEIKHAFEEAEISAFAHHINTLLLRDKDVRHELPITAANLFDVVSKSVLLW